MSIFNSFEVVDLMQSEREIIGDPFYQLVAKFKFHSPGWNNAYNGEPNAKAFKNDYDFEDNLIVRIHNSVIPRTV